MQQIKPRPKSARKPLRPPTGSGVRIKKAGNLMALESQAALRNKGQRIEVYGPDQPLASKPRHAKDNEFEAEMEARFAARRETREAEKRYGVQDGARKKN